MGFPTQTVTSTAIAAAGGLLAANNLSDLASAATGRSNLAVGQVLSSEVLLGADAPSFDINPAPTTGRHLLIVARLRSDAAAANDGLRLRFNNDSGANYDFEQVDGSAALATAAATAGATAIGPTNTAAGNTANPSEFAAVSILIPHYLSAAMFKAAVITAGIFPNSQHANVTHGRWANAAAVTRVTILPLAGANWKASSMVSVYVLS